MYLQIEIHSEDRNFQKILWRDDPMKPVREYRLCAITHGTAPASYLATRVLKQLVIDEGLDFPKAANSVLHNFYIDDGLFGAESADEAVALKNVLSELLRKGKFELHKWFTNSLSVLNFLSQSKSIDNASCRTADSKFIKVLGLRSDPKQDEFTYNISFCDDFKDENPTIRSILSCVSKIFDPLGWLSSIIITAKILIQELWKHQLAWDDPVPQDIKEKWIKYRVDISQVTLTVPRTVLLYSPSGFELYCFCDASEKAYAAVILVYLKSSTITTTQISVLTSKTRVAPLKTISIPRLDLCSAVLLVHLLQTVLKSLTFQIDAVRAFIDSTIVLAWLKSEPSRWQIFVANRVSEIQSILPVQHWNHISSGQNPADCASRGLPPNELVNFDLWWSGPQWMNSGDISHLEEISLSTDALKEESKKTSCLIETTPIDFPIIYNVSSYVKLKRIIAWCLCFIMNCKSPNNRINGYLTSSEIKLARNVLVKIVQKQEFLREYHQLKNSKPIS
ncbi:uncharacterized protein [Parasteatoda tepidariorum]|uniref:uncharacterized protein n=1 Tax=Parasteatoda tepidariorum TaxID=114398 RepID=UPI0039BCEFCC